MKGGNIHNSYIPGKKIVISPHSSTPRGNFGNPKVEAWQSCIECEKKYKINEVVYKCKCGGLLEINYNLNKIYPEDLKRMFDIRKANSDPVNISGVWRFRELLPFVRNYEKIVTMPEGNTILYDAPKCAEYVGLKKLQLKHLGLNPTGSFKDYGMTACITQANQLGKKIVASASTGNTGASMAAYAARAGMKAILLIPEGQISLGKLSQSLDYGAMTFQIDGNFDKAMEIVQMLGAYLVNSLNPFRIEGQKAIAFELLQQRNWKVPDAIVLPGGNLGNSSAIAKGLFELCMRGFINKIPRIIVIQAEGANPLYNLYKAYERGEEKELERVDAHTRATAIRIGNPVNWKKCMRAIKKSKGLVEQVSEEGIANAKAVVGRDGIGCEPASAATVAGIRKLVANGKIDRNEDVVGILTGHVLKDPNYTVEYHTDELQCEVKENERIKVKSSFANKPIKVKADVDEIKKLIESMDSKE